MRLRENELKMMNSISKSPMINKKVKINDLASEYEGTLNTSSKESEIIGSPNSITINDSLKKQSLETDNSQSPTRKNKKFIYTPKQGTFLLSKQQRLKG